MAQKECVLSPIGYIQSGKDGFVLNIKEDFREALSGLQGFSHINVLWWSHLADSQKTRAMLTCEKPYINSPEQLGVFATRSPIRPNPVCLSVAQIISVNETRGEIVLAYIDAEDGTPIIDLKPYLPCTDRVRDVTTPEWNCHWPACYEDSAQFDWEAEFVFAR